MARPGLFGLPVVATVVFVVLVALLASLAIWKWTSASSLSSKQDDREAVGEAASAYGNVALNYNAQNYQSQMDKAQKLMGGDLLESFKTNTLPSLGDTFKSNPELALTSKTNQVFVGSVDGKFATAVVMVDITVRTKEGSTAAPPRCSGSPSPRSTARGRSPSSTRPGPTTRTSRSRPSSRDHPGRWRVEGAEEREAEELTFGLPRPVRKRAGRGHVMRTTTGVARRRRGIMAAVTEQDGQDAGVADEVVHEFGALLGAASVLERIAGRELERRCGIRHAVFEVLLRLSHDGPRSMGGLA